MSNKAFQQNLDDKKGPQPGGPYLIQMLFKEPVEMPDNASSLCRVSKSSFDGFIFPLSILLRYSLVIPEATASLPCEIP